MTRTGTVLAALAAAAALGLSTSAFAQLSSNGGPIAYSADNLEYVDGERQLILSGNVEVAQDTSTLRADKLTLARQLVAAIAERLPPRR